MPQYDVTISKQVYKYYTYSVITDSKEKALAITSDKIQKGELSEAKDLSYSMDEPDFDIKDDPSAYKVVDATILQ